MLDIIMATYNGEKYLDEQIDSIMSQTDQDFHLLIGDDASTDNTPSIVNAWVARYPDKITFKAFPNNVGPCANFSRLLEMSDAEYILLADQDDVWFPEKIQLFREKMQSLEHEFGSDIPLMVFSDLQVIDEKGKVISPSWKKYVGLKKRSYGLNALLCRHAYLGCSLMINKELLYLATPIPQEAGMHDYWLTLIATTLGEIWDVGQVTMSYRLHGKNVVGAHTFDHQWFRKQIKENSDFVQHQQQRVLRAYARAFMFYQRFKGMLTIKNKETLENFLELKYLPFYKELYYRFRYGFLEQTFWQNVALLYASRKMGSFKECPIHRHR